VTPMFLLRNVALLSYSPEELLAMGRQKSYRAVTFEAFEGSPKTMTSLRRHD
jgi:hypothetical protein